MFSLPSQKKKNTMVCFMIQSKDALAFVNTAVTIFWLVAIAVVCLRRISATFARVAGYGGRLIAAETKTTSTNGSSMVYCRRFLLADVPRRTSFLAFYLVGASTCVGLYLFVDVLCAHQLPTNPTTTISYGWIVSNLFFIHCAVRWIESFFRQRFRPRDSITLFAMLSGCGFYVVAALSTCSWPDLVDRDDTNRVLHRPVIAALVCVHMSRHLRCARCEPSVAPRSASYQFPTGCLFSAVQEPHYMCEVLLYVTQWLMLVYMHGGMQLPALLMICFTSFNLFVTAQEHRQFWQTTPFANRVPRWLLMPGFV
jgi:hypothetical protein